MFNIERRYNIDRLNTRWVFKGYSDVDVKIVLGNQALLGTGPLPDWLCNPACGRSMVVLDTKQDNQSLAMYCGALRYNLTAEDMPKISIDKLNLVERNLNEKSDWPGILVYEPEREEDGEVVWYLRRKPPAKLKKILTIGIYDGHAFLIKDIAKLVKTYACVHCTSQEI